MINIYNGYDIRLSTAEYVVIPVNCVGVAGAGLALWLRQCFYAVEQTYIEACKAKTLYVGSELLVVDRFILAPTKRHFIDNSNLEDVIVTIRLLRSLIDSKRIKHVAIPLLGTGCGKLPKRIIRGLIVNAFHDCDAIVDVYG